MSGKDDDATTNQSTSHHSNHDASKTNMPLPSTPTPKGNFTLLAFSSSKDLKRFAKKYRTEIAASSSSMLSTFSAFPLDLVKSRMQSYDTSFGLTIKDAYKAEGLIAFWRGVLPPLVSVTLVRTFSFSIYQRAKYSFDKAITKATGQSPLAIANAPGSYPNLYTLACFGAAGATSGALITTFSCPFELTKLNQQLAGKMAREANHPGSASRAVDVKQAGSLNTARRLFQERGIKGLYVGYRLHMLRDTIGTAIYFITYESAKQLMANARGKSPTSPYAVVVAGGLCGILTASLIYPVDVAKTVYQKQILGTKPGHVDAPRPSISFFQTGSYRGLGVSVLRSCVINMIFFSHFELVKKQINALDVD